MWLGVCYLSHKPSNLDWDRDIGPAFSLYPTYACFLKQISKVQIQLRQGLQTCHSVDQCATSAFYSQNSLTTHTPTLQILPLPSFPQPACTFDHCQLKHASGERWNLEAKPMVDHPRSLYWFHCPCSPPASHWHQWPITNWSELFFLSNLTWHHDRNHLHHWTNTHCSQQPSIFCIQYALQLHVPITFSSMRADYQNPLLRCSTIKGGEQPWNMAGVISYPTAISSVWSTLSLIV